MPIWLIVVIVIVVLLLLFVISNYNTLVKLRNMVRDQWSQIEVQLKKRADLIPNLVETVKGYAKHEKETLDAVISARNKAVSATTPEEEMKANGELSNALGRLLAVSEAYPDLKANTNFIDLQNNLKEVEEKIAYSRQFYNDGAMKYRNKIEMFPSNIVASIFGFKVSDAPFFEASEEDKKTPKVQF